MTTKDIKSSNATTQATIRLSLSESVWEIFLVNISIWLSSANIANVELFALRNPSI